MRGRRWVLFLGLSSAATIAAAYGCSTGTDKPPPGQTVGDASREGSTGSICNDLNTVFNPDIVDQRAAGAGVSVQGKIKLSQALPGGSLVKVELVPITFEEKFLRIPNSIIKEAAGKSPTGVSELPRPTTELTFLLQNVRPGKYYLRFSSASSFKEDGGLAEVTLTDQAGFFAGALATRYDQATTIEVSDQEICGIDFSVANIICLGENGSACTADKDCRGHLCENQQNRPFVINGSCDTDASKCAAYWDHCDASSPFPNGVQNYPPDASDADKAALIAKAGSGPNGVCTGAP
jgi:hypothetical protein